MGMKRLLHNILEGLRSLRILFPCGSALDECRDFSAEVRETSRRRMADAARSIGADMAKVMARIRA